MIKILRDNIAIPMELFSYMNNPLFIFIYSSNTKTYWLRSFRIHLIIKLIMRFIKGEEIIFASKDKVVDSMAIYKPILYINRQKMINNYRIVNYESKFLLFKSQSDDISTDREGFWENISDYHEHKKVSLQKEDVIKRTKWLSKIINDYKAESVLELGCGGGRNLFFIKKENPNCNLYGVEINPEAVNVAKQQLGNSFTLLSNSIYDLDKIESNSIDIVFTSGVLMHIPHDKVKAVIDNIKRISKQTIIHYELHGLSHQFDFHRYPRDYKEMYSNFKNYQYEVFSKNDFRNAGTESFHHALYVLEKNN